MILPPTAAAPRSIGVVDDGKGRGAELIEAGTPPGLFANFLFTMFALDVSGGATPLRGGCDDPIALFVAYGRRRRAPAHLRHAASMPWQSNTRRETAGHLPPRAAAKASRVWPGGIRSR